MPKSRQLTSDLECDVCIVGGGISGLTAAYQLANSGQQVVVLDDGPLASGMTHVTTAHLSNVIDDRFVNMLGWHGEANARLAVQSHGAAIDYIASVSRELNVDCDFKRLDGYLFAAPDHNDVDLHDEFKAAQQVGIAVEWETRAPLAAHDTGACLRFPNQARFHPFKYLEGMIQEFKRAGGKVFTNRQAIILEH